jgi:hypothetical protein
MVNGEDACEKKKCTAYIPKQSRNENCKTALSATVDMSRRRNLGPGRRRRVGRRRYVDYNRRRYNKYVTGCTSTGMDELYNATVKPKYQEIYDNHKRLVEAIDKNIGSAPFVDGEYRVFRSGKNQKYCADEPGRIVCNRNVPQSWEGFLVTQAKTSGRWNIKGGRGGMYCSDYDNEIKCDKEEKSDWEEFRYEKANDATPRWALRGGKHNKICAHEDDGRIRCNRNAQGGWERFEILPQ